MNLLVHLDERRPGALEVFAGEFLRRINAEFAADGDFAPGVVEHVGRAFGEDAVPPPPGYGVAGALRARRAEAQRRWIGVGAEAEEDFAGVVHVHVGVHHRGVFGEHHLAHAISPGHGMPVTFFHTTETLGTAALNTF